MNGVNLFRASEKSLDDLMRAVFKQLLAGRGNHQVQSEKGESTEIFGALLELKNPRARLSRSLSRAKVFSPLGELFWYLAGDESIDFIKYYIPKYPSFSNDGVKANGAYGPRLFGLGAEQKVSCESQWDRALNALRKMAGSRNAVIQIYANEDAFIGNKDRPCTCTLQFGIRNGRLLMHTHMRSNDAFLGLPHDIFSFTMLQEIAARELNVGLGTYCHSVTSLHLYHDNPAKKNFPTSGAKAYLDEGLHDFVPMPEMPLGDPWPCIDLVRIAEKKIRLGNVDYKTPAELPKYWSDLIELFRIYNISKGLSPSVGLGTEMQERRRMLEIMKNISSVYGIYIRDRLEKQQGPIGDLFESSNKVS